MVGHEEDRALLPGAFENVEDLEGRVVLSKQKADFMRVWDGIKEAHDNGSTVRGRLMRRIKGGIVVDLLGVYLAEMGAIGGSTSPDPTAPDPGRPDPGMAAD